MEYFSVGPAALFNFDELKFRSVTSFVADKHIRDDLQRNLESSSSSVRDFISPLVSPLVSSLFLISLALMIDLSSILAFCDIGSAVVDK